MKLGTGYALIAVLSLAGSTLGPLVGQSAPLVQNKSGSRIVTLESTTSVLGTPWICRLFPHLADCKS